MRFMPFLDVTMIGARHSITSVTGYNALLLKQLQFYYYFSLYANGTDCGVFTQNGTAPSTNSIRNSSPCIILICLSKKVGNSCIILSIVGLSVAAFTVS